MPDAAPTRQDAAREVCDATLAAFEELQASFRAITARARDRFVNRDWRGAHADAVERLELYPRAVRALVARSGELLGDACHDLPTWRRAKASYARAIARRADAEIGESFFNSLTRRIFSTVGVNPEVEFVASHVEPAARPSSVVRSFPAAGRLREALVELLGGLPFGTGRAWAEREADRALPALRAQLARRRTDEAAALEVVRAPFYRNSHAYLVGRVWCGGSTVPFVLALRHPHAGIEVDAVLTSEDEVSIVFSFARSYFHVEVDTPHELVAFLRAIMPRKPVAELYIAIGFHKHGKTELYRSLLGHLERSSDRFTVTRGAQGLVMLVFTLPSLDIVFKVIKDAPGQPKSVTRSEVLERYRLVFTHDRVGRLVDAQEFEHLRFERARFEDDLLDRLLAEAPSTVALDGDAVVFRHLFTERRVVPLDLYLREQPSSAARAAALDLGHAIKDLAAANIFPGDLLLKNFGVTRHGRIVFYDYDELCLLTDCSFRRLPPARTPEEELAAEPWFYVAERDIFPEEFRPFIGLPAEVRDAFLAEHGDLFDVDLWLRMQELARTDHVLEEQPYPAERRLGWREGG